MQIKPWALLDESSHSMTERDAKKKVKPYPICLKTESIWTDFYISRLLFFFFQAFQPSFSCQRLIWLDLILSYVFQSRHAGRTLISHDLWYFREKKMEKHGIASRLPGDEIHSRHGYFSFSLSPSRSLSLFFYFSHLSHRFFCFFSQIRVGGLQLRG